MNNKPSEINSRQPWFVVVMVVMMRLVVGGVFAFSGFVKAIDPWGTYYKVTEYLMALGWDAWTGQALLFAFALPAIELMLGVALIIGAFRRCAPIAVLVMMAGMLPLTLWLALTGAVPDCGCFGDAWVLSNWVTFWKNVFLTLGAAFLLILGRKVPGVYGPAVQWMVMVATFALAMGIALHGYFTQPLIDFRPFKIGTRLVSGQPSVNDTDYLFIYEKEGVRHEFTIDSVPDEEDGWKFVARREVPGNTPNMGQGERALALTDHGTDVADDVLDNERVLLLLFPDLPQVSIATTFVINELTENALSHGVRVYGITSATNAQIAEWADVSMADYPMLVADDSDIKMMARGNPAVVYVVDGTIRWKRALGSINSDRLHDSELTFDTFSDDIQPGLQLRRMGGFYALALLLILIVNRTHLLVRPFIKNKRAQTDQESKRDDIED